jgi:hypothetical protein
MSASDNLSFWIKVAARKGLVDLGGDILITQQHSAATLDIFRVSACRFPNPKHSPNYGSRRSLSSQAENVHT